MDEPSDTKNRPGDYAVGYCKPPAQHQFRPGNPGYTRMMRRQQRAQDRRERTLEDMFVAELLKAVVLQENGQPKRMTKLDAVIKRVVNGAAKGELARLSHRWATMSQEFSLTQSAHSVRQVLTDYNRATLTS